MALFEDYLNFNGQVFDGMVRETPNLRMNELLNSGAIVEKPEYKVMATDQKGGNLITTLIKARLSGSGVNYNGTTDITSVERGNYTMNRIVVGRAQGWLERDFNVDISGDDYSAAAGEVAEFFDDIDQDTIVSELKGIFGMTTPAACAAFVTNHTYDISSSTAGTFGATTLNTGLQQALGDNKSKFALAIMHSKVATDAENLNLLEYMKYTDSQGVQRSLQLGTINGRLVLIDDNMPTEDVDAVYTLTTDTEIDTSKTYYTESGGVYTAVESPIIDDIGTYYELTAEAYTKYTTYVFGNGAIEMTDCGAKVPYEMWRDPATNGGETTLFGRQRKAFAPYGLSWKGTAVSPTASELETSTNWTLANDNATTKSYYPAKAIAIARIITR